MRPFVPFSVLLVVALASAALAQSTGAPPAAGSPASPQWLSLKLDLPTGATIVCTFGLVLVLMAVARPLLFCAGRSGQARAGASG